MLTVTFIRHGESTDNLKPLWAGWADAPLSNHGMNQAKALGAAWAETPVVAIYASPLKRAHTTALQVLNNQPTPPPITITPLIREQHFGVAEGKPWAASADKSKGATTVYAPLLGRKEKFPEGESLDDVAERAQEAIDTLIWPHMEKAKGKKEGEYHVVVVSHGICISELVAALLRKGTGETEVAMKYRGLVNTGWTRLVAEKTDPVNGYPAQVVVKVVATNQAPHLVGIVRQGGGIGSAAHDPKQREIKEFFSGGGATAAA